MFLLPQELHLKVPPTMAGISDTVQLLHDASQWFSGGVKEMRVSCAYSLMDVPSIFEVVGYFLILNLN